MGQFFKRQVGGAELIALQDSWTTMAPASFFPTVTAEMWDPYKEFLNDDGEFTLNFGSWLIHSEGRTILVDTGWGGRPIQFPLKEPPALPQIMQEAGAKPDDVDLVIFTHLHGDHTGWNTIDENGKPVPLFKNARYVIQQKEWDFWVGNAERKPQAQYDNVLAPLEAAGVLDLVEGEHPITSEVVTILTPGHTPGHVSFVIESEGARAYVLGDAVHQPVQVSATEWSPGADTDPEESARIRKTLLHQAAREGALIAGGHFPFPSMGQVVEEKGYLKFSPTHH